MNDIVTENFSEFGYREKKMATELLVAWTEGKTARPQLELGDNVRPAFNKRSGWVFLTNDEYESFVLNGEGELEIHLSCPQCGYEGFPDALVDNADDCEECGKYGKAYLE